MENLEQTIDDMRKERTQAAITSKKMIETAEEQARQAREHTGTQMAQETRRANEAERRAEEEKLARDANTARIKQLEDLLRHVASSHKVCESAKEHSYLLIHGMIAHSRERSSSRRGQ